MGVIFTPRYWTGTPADRLLIPYRAEDTSLVKDALFKKIRFLLATHVVPEGEYVLVSEPYPQPYAADFIPNLLSLFHHHNVHAIIRTNNPHKSDFKYLDKDDICAVTLTDGARPNTRRLRNYDEKAAGPTTMSERICRAFSAQDARHCRVMIFFSEGASYDFIVNAFTYIKADMFVIEGFDFTDVEKTAIKAAAGDRWCTFAKDGPEIRQSDYIRYKERRMRHGER